MKQVEKLSRQIERVARVSERATRKEQDGDAHLRPAIDLIDALLEASHHAIGRGDPGEMATAVQQLEGFQE